MESPAEWPEAIGRTLARCRMLRSHHVLAATASTQDVAKRLADQSGLVVTTLRQTAGRGRLGRSWADTGEHGVAATFVLPASSAGPWGSEELVVRTAVAVAKAIEHASGLQVGIKWPNDIVVGGRKLAGILIERIETPHAATCVGVGINVGQEEFPPELGPHATSLRLEGRPPDRLPVLLALIAELDAALFAPIEALASAYASHDVLTGSTARFGTPEGECEGLVKRVDPFVGLVVAVGQAPGRDGECFLPAATTTVLSWKTSTAASR